MDDQDATRAAGHSTTGERYPAVEFINCYPAGGMVTLCIVSEGKERFYTVKPETLAAGVGRAARALAERGWVR